jgi:hypothetical protein
MPRPAAGAGRSCSRRGADRCDPPVCRAGVPFAGLQHGFIYRHWLNYLHEPDEVAPAGDDRGFPAPDRTLVFDRYAAEHLTTAGRFAPSSLSVTGSARLDDLANRFNRQRAARPDIRRELGVEERQPLAILAAKFIEIERELPGLVAAVAAMSDVRLIVKPHPAETPDVYGPFVASAPNVSVAPEGADLSRLLAGADAVVTMNSTVAIDGLVLGLPALVVGLPNNLQPFVEAGAMLGARSGDDLRPALESLLRDPDVRAAPARAAAAFTARYGMQTDGHAADRAAAEILALAG